MGDGGDRGERDQDEGIEPREDECGGEQAEGECGGKGTLPESWGLIGEDESKQASGMVRITSMPRVKRCAE